MKYQKMILYEMAIPPPYGQEEVDVEALEAKIAELMAEKEKLENEVDKKNREANRQKKRSIVKIKKSQDYLL